MLLFGLAAVLSMAAQASFMATLRKRGCGARELRCNDGQPTELTLEMKQLRDMDSSLSDDVVLKSLFDWPELRSLKQLRISWLQGDVPAVPSELCNFVQLELLQLTGSGLQSVPSCLAKLELKELSLGANRLQTLPATFSGMRSLRKLNLANNQFDEFPEAILSLKNLEELFLQHNRLTSVPSGLQKLQKLRRLSLVGNRLTALPEELGRIPSLKALMLDGNRLDDIPSSLKPLWLAGGLHADGNPMDQRRPRPDGEL
ncbi:MFHAS1 [Symbiodinium sp. CCMP2592]|nr:MFHAS1 [Symbiodinium sp. CCMP2592]